MTTISRLCKSVSAAATTTNKKATISITKKERKINKKVNNRITTIKMKRVAKREVRISSSKRITTKLSDKEKLSVANMQRFER